MQLDGKERPLWISYRPTLVNSKDAGFRFRGPVAEAVDQRDINRKVLNSVAAFTRSTDLSSPKAPGDPTFKFTSDLADLRISIQHNISPTALAAYGLDRFSVAARQWFLNAALANPIIARDAPLIVASPSRPRLSPAGPPRSWHRLPPRVDTGTGKGTDRESAT
jgi:hypothetical protein